MTIPLAQGELNGIPPLAVRSASMLRSLWNLALRHPWLRAKLTVAPGFAINSTGLAVS